MLGHKSADVHFFNVMSTGTENFRVNDLRQREGLVCTLLCPKVAPRSAVWKQE